VNKLGDVGAGHVLGRYELLMPIASGGMATVWAARMKGTRGFQKIVAIKTILPQLSDDPQFEQMFLDEASLASRIRHPNVAQILDLGEQEGVLFLVMDWVDGEPLSVLLKAASRDTGSIPLPITLRIITQACAGMHSAHEVRDESGAPLGLVHRDASPQNLLVTFDGVVKVVDFGIAKATGRASADTNAGQIKGKAAYMSPEQVKGGELDRRTDVFALGIILYLMTTGKHPFRGENDGATLYNISSERAAVLPSKIVKQYPLSLEAVVMKALAKNPAHRFASAHELQRALDMALPASQRLTTDVEVAAFVQHLLGERREQRKKALKAALLLADERTQGKTPAPTPTKSDALSHSGFTPSSNVSGLLPPRELGSVQTGEGGSDASRASAGPSVGGMTTGATGRMTMLNREWWSDGRHLALALGVALFAGLGIFAASKWAASSASSSARPASSATAVSAQAAAAPQEPPSAAPGALGPAPETPEKSGDAEAARVKAASRTPPRSLPLKTSASATSSASPRPAPTGTAFVPPVRNPGF